jgi:exodeoxyribonuclease VII small subunit
MNEASDTTEATFDGLLRQLQRIVEHLECEDMSLEESLRAFEQGMDLSQRGQKILNAAERKIEILMKNGHTEPIDME